MRNAIFIARSNIRSTDTFSSGLCWIRLITLSLRIAWVFYPRNIRLGIAAQVFVNVGTVLLFFTDFFFTQRIIRAQHPHFGWSLFFSPLTILLCAWTVLTVVAVIVVSIQSFYTLSINTRRIDRDVQIYVETAFAVIAALPLFMVLLSTVIRQIPKYKHQTMDKFGAGSMRAKIYLVCAASLILGFANAFKAGIEYFGPFLLSDPTPWFYSRGVFYGLGLAPELIVLYMFIVFKVNQRFVIPDGAKGPYSYAGGFTFAGEAGNEKRTLGLRDSSKNLVGGSSPSLAQSYGGRSNRTSMSRTRESVISWGGIYHENTAPGIGEDGAEMVPYSGIEDQTELELPAYIPGADQEMGWDAKSGKWQLRPVSTQTFRNAVPVTAEEHV